MGVRFPGYAAADASYVYDHSLYRGAAGVGLVLLDLARATRDARYLELCDEVRDGLIESTPLAPRLEPGLYTGFGGVALFHLARARLLSDRSALEHALAIGRRLARSPLVDTDLISGAAGTGMSLLALYWATKEPALLDGVGRVLAFLHETAERQRSGLAWLPRDPRQALTPEEADRYDGMEQTRHTGLAHGAAGICLFLIECAAATGNPLATRLYEGGFRWLDATAVAVGRGLTWPRTETDAGRQPHWCHGSAGIGLAYLAFYRHTASRDALAKAVAAGHATWDAMRRSPREKTCHCHGLSGAVELFVELSGHDGRRTWWRRAEMLISRLISAAQRPGQNERAGRHESSPSALKGEGTGLGVGTAGVVRELLRFANHPVFPILTPWRERLALDARSAVGTSVGAARDRRLERPSSSRRSAFVPPQLLNHLPDLLPRAALRFADNRFVAIGPLDSERTQTAVHLLSERPAGVAFFEALERITTASEKLQAAYSHLLAPGAMGPWVEGTLLRELAGLALLPNAHATSLSRIARRMTANAVNALEVALSRIAADLKGPLRNVVGGRLEQIRVSSSDSHRRGQRVVALRFEDGLPLFYKPRPVDLDRELAGASGNAVKPSLAERCNRWLDPAVSGGCLPTHRIIAAGPWHGYAECIRPGKTARIDPQIDLHIPHPSMPMPQSELVRLPSTHQRRYWYSAGLLAGYAHTLGIFDLHFENVVCGRSQSVREPALHLVDLELAFGRLDSLADTQLIETPRSDVSAGNDLHSHAVLDSNISLTCGSDVEEWALEWTPDGVRPMSEPRRATAWTLRHLAQNPDGSFGYGSTLGVFLRGVADQWWLLRSHAQEVADHLRASLSGVPARVLLKPTQSYLGPLTRRKMGGAARPGAAINPRWPAALPLMNAELQQLEQLDIPYFFRFLGEETGPRAGIYWMPDGVNHSRRVRQVDAGASPDPFWTIVDRQSDVERFARVVVDIVRAGSPAGSFDHHERSLGVRALRPPGDGRIWVVVLLGERRDERLTCLVEPGGTFEWWLD